MEFEIMDMLVSFLCPTSSAASSCQQFISNHSSVAPPLGQYIYFLFFPTVFLLLFLWIVFKDAVKANKGISLIATIAVYVFIIIQGLYPIFLALGELWIVGIFLLGFFYIITRRFRGDGGGKGGKMPGMGGGIAGAISDQAKKKITKKAIKSIGLLSTEERIIDDIEEKAKKKGIGSLSESEQTLLAARYGVSIEALRTRNVLKDLERKRD